jgi:glycosyltransferase involved in cell wall biosynthesis
MKLLSVIITTYNAEKTLNRLLDSIFQQTGLGVQFELELLIIDDCSTDKTIQILKARDIPYLSTQKNTGGPNAGRNIGLKMVKGDAICIVDHDDEWLPDRAVEQLKALELAPIATCGYFSIDEKNGVQTSHVTSSKENDLATYPANVSFLSTMRKSKSGQKMYFGSIMFSGKLNTILFEEHFGRIDYDWILKLLFHRESIEVCKPLYKRYVDGSNLSLSLSYRQQDFYYSLLTIEQYAAEFPKAYIEAYRRIHDSRARYHYLMGDMRKARFYFLRGERSVKVALYYLSTFWGSAWIKKRFKVY